MSYYIALGDSITTGYGVGVQNSFSAHLFHRLNALEPWLGYRNLAANGLTTGQLAAFLNRVDFLSYLRQSSLITITIGSNDLLDAVPLFMSGRFDARHVCRNIHNHLQEIGWQIRSISPLTRIKIAGIYNPLPASPYAAYSVAAQVFIDGINDCIGRWAKKYRAERILLDHVFKGREFDLLGPDHVHPSLLGHRLIADAFFQSQPVRTN